MLRRRKEPRPAARNAAATGGEEERYRIAYEPRLVPPLTLMRTEGIDVLEEWFRWGEEWSVLLRVYGSLRRDSAVLEIGCGLGRTAFPLRYVLSKEGTYDGFDVGKDKIAFLNDTFHRAYGNFRFSWADVHNTYYNPTGALRAAEFSFPYRDRSFDVVYAASVFTHMLPEPARHYFRESARVLREGGRCVFSFFVLDNYDPDRQRPLGFARAAFNFDHAYQDYGERFALSSPENPEEMTAYGLDFLRGLADDAGLTFVQEPLPGFWSGRFDTWIGAQDLVVLTTR